MIPPQASAPPVKQVFSDTLSIEDDPHGYLNELEHPKIKKSPIV